MFTKGFLHSKCNFSVEFQHNFTSFDKWFIYTKVVGGCHLNLNVGYSLTYPFPNSWQFFRQTYQKVDDLQHRITSVNISYTICLSDLLRLLSEVAVRFVHASWSLSLDLSHYITQVIVWWQPGYFHLFFVTMLKYELSFELKSKWEKFNNFRMGKKDKKIPSVNDLNMSKVAS